MKELSHPPLRYDLKRAALLDFLEQFVFPVDHTLFPNEDCIDLLYGCIHLDDKEFYHLYCKARGKGLSFVRWDHYSDDLNLKYDAIENKAFGYVEYAKQNAPVRESGTVEGEM